MIKIEGPEWETLRILREENQMFGEIAYAPPITNSQIMKKLRIEKSRMSKTFKALREANLIYGQKGSKYYILTDQGKWYADFYKKIKEKKWDKKTC